MGAESERVQLEAARLLLEKDKAGLTVNVGIQQHINPGYVVDVSKSDASETARILRRAGSTGNVIDNKG
jgi:hypothetical protein